MGQFNFLIAKVAQLVEHNLAKVGVAGSNPVFRSKGGPKPVTLSFFWMSTPIFDALARVVKW